MLAFQSVGGQIVAQAKHQERISPKQVQFAEAQRKKSLSAQFEDMNRHIFDMNHQPQDEGTIFQTGQHKLELREPQQILKTTRQPQLEQMDTFEGSGQLVGKIYKGEMLKPSDRHLLQMRHEPVASLMVQGPNYIDVAAASQSQRRRLNKSSLPELMQIQSKLQDIEQAKKVQGVEDTATHGTKIHQRGANNQRNRSMGHVRWTTNPWDQRTEPSDVLQQPPIPAAKFGRFIC